MHAAQSILEYTVLQQTIHRNLSFFPLFFIFFFFFHWSSFVFCSLLILSPLDVHSEQCINTFHTLLHLSRFLYFFYIIIFSFPINMIASLTLFCSKSLLMSRRASYITLTLMSSFFCLSSSSVLPCICPVSAMLPSHLRPPWSTSPPRLWRALGPWSGSKASNSRSPTSPLRVPTTLQSPHRAWANCTQAQAAEATVGARVGSGGVRLELPGTEGRGQADRGQIQAAGIIWWNRSATEDWM